MEPSVEEKFERVRRTLRVGCYLTDRTQVMDVRRIGDDAVLIVRRGSTPWPYGVPLDLADTSREFYYDDPVASFDEWLMDLDTYLMVAFDTGITYWGARAAGPDYIELRLEPAWPSDRRLEFSTSGLRVTSPGGHPLGRIARIDGARIHARDVTVGERCRRSALLALFRLALVQASERGVDRVTTDVHDPVLAVLGFVEDGNVLSASTDLLAADALAAAEIIRADRATDPPPPAPFRPFGSYAR